MAIDYYVNDYVNFIKSDNSIGENGRIVEITITLYGIFYKILDEVTENVYICSRKQLRDCNYE